MLNSSLFFIALIMALSFAQLEGSSIQHRRQLREECPHRCGHVKIRRPLGIGLNCSDNEYFSLTCDDSSPNPKPILTKLNLEVLDVSEDGVTVNFRKMVISTCETTTTSTTATTTTDNGNSSSNELGELQVMSSFNWSGSPFYFHYSTVLVLNGCDGVGSFYNETGAKVGGCGSICTNSITAKGHNDESNQLSDGCYGYQCCKSSLMRYYDFIDKFSIGISTSGEKGSCMTATIVSEEFQKYDFTMANIADSLVVPVKLIYADPYNHGDGDYELIAIGRWILVVGVTVLGTLFASCGCFWTCWFCRTKEARREAKIRAKYFKGRLEESSSNKESIYKTKLFKAKELKTATDNFNADRILGQGGQGTVYKGMSSDGQVIAVKKSKTFEEVHWKQFVNEVILLSQVNHRNVVRLLGCCLETKLPLLVYEFIPNGTLSDHIHNSTSDFVLTWDMRVRIASEAASAIAYLHSSSANNPIYHRDIKSTNILLDAKFHAKVSDFGISKAVSIDQTHLTTCVQGTIGYLDPEYFRSSQFSEKSDVYSFGVILVELLTGQHPIRTTKLEEEKSLVMYFTSAMNKSALEVILDPLILEGAEREDITNVANLAMRCLNSRGIDRPTMKEVAMELQGLRKTKPYVQDQDVEV